MSEKYKEMLDRMSSDDAIHIGDAVSRMFRGEFWGLFLAVISQLKSMELQNSRLRSESSDKVLGRLEAYETIIANLEGYVRQADELRAPKEDDELSANELVTEQKEPLRGGAV